ncbi:transposase [Streptomyces sp. MJP52]|uniref:transposase n=1 Tax=Streptomyces sp. MJP52 TaxID=2940555 RepID=UPI0032AF45B6
MLVRADGSRGREGARLRPAEGIPEPKGQRAHRRRNEVERTINRLKNSRAVTTRYDKRAHVFQGAVITAAIRLRLRP